MQKLITLSLLFLSLNLTAQSFKELIRQADEFYQQEDYKASGETFTKAFALEEGNTSQYYNAACSWALAGNSDAAFKYLNKSVEKGWHNLKHIKRDSDLDSLHELPAWENVLTAVQANLDEYEKDFDKPLKTQLEAIYVRDQMLRRLVGDVEEKFGRDSDEMLYFWKLMNEQDSLNELEVEQIIKERGWVGKNLVGSKANTTLWLVIQHAPLETQEKYLPMLKESVKKGESRGGHLALLEDRILMRNEKPQIYGSQIRTNPDTDEQYVYEIKEPEYVNQRRAEVGLGPIEDYVKRWGIEWTVEQKEK